MQAKRFFIAAVILPSLFSTCTTVAAESDASTGAVIVTATRSAQSVDDTLAAVTVITRETIEASQSNSVMDLLQSSVPGIDFSRNGGPGSTTVLLLRGGESDHALILVDGVRASSVTSGAFNWSGLALDQIERIEIVRGPGSSLYGSEAIGGVIQIFTRKGRKVHASIGGGSYGTGKMSVGVGEQIDGNSVHFNLSHEQSRGFSATNSNSSAYEADDDGYRNTSIDTGFSISLSDATQISLNLLRSESSSEYDNAGYSNAHDETVDSSGELRLDWQTFYNWSQRLVINASEQRYQSHDSWPAIISSHRRGANWQNDFTIGAQQLLTFGIDWQQDNGVIDGSYNETLDNHAAYLQYQWQGEQYNLLLGGRGDDHSEYGQHSTGRITLGSRLGEGRIYATYASAFKAPVFNELYYPFYGDPNLKPEESTTGELGYRLHGFQASVYRTRLKNMIQSDPSTWTAVNVGRAQLEGLELEYRKQIGRWQLNSAVTLQKTEDLDSSTQLIRRAEEKVQLSARGPLDEQTSIGIEVNYTGPRTDFGGAELTAFTLLNLTGEYRLNKEWVVRGRIDNLLDEQYALAYGYTAAGASAYLTLSYQQ